MPLRAQDLRYGSGRVHPCHFHEADQLILIIGTDENASIEICCESAFDGLEVFLVVPEAFSLTHGSFTIYFANSFNESSVEISDSHFHAELLGSIYSLPDAVFGLLFPPM